jgi:hypothetical protein
MPSVETSVNLGRGGFAPAMGKQRAGRVAVLAEATWLILAAAILMAPALVWGRPFVFGDTPYYWAWGGDILDALQRPWPHPGQLWVTGRSLHGWGSGAHDTTPADLRFSLTFLTARSAFYAVPLNLLINAGGLWLVAGLQSLVAAWTIRVTTRAAAPGSTNLMFLGLALVLAAVTSLGFETAYAMPDVFGGLALLAAAVLITLPDRLDRVQRAGLAVAVLYAVLCHAENALNMAAAIALGFLLQWRAGVGWRRAAMRVVPTAAALVVGLVTVTCGGLIMGAVFGRPAHMPPFAADRLLADGGAQSFLRQACPNIGLAACDLADRAPAPADYYNWVYPLEGPPPPALADSNRYILDQFDRLQARHVSDAEADHRERFVREQGRLILGGLASDSLREAKAAFTNGAITFVNFGVDHNLDTVQALAQAGRSGMRADIDQILPGGVECPRPGAASCGQFDLDRARPIQYGAVIGSLVLLGVCGFRRTTAPTRELASFMLLITGLVLANAFLCGALSGPYSRYQSRVEWLIPLCALLLLNQWLERMRGAAGAPSA